MNMLKKVSLVNIIALAVSLMVPAAVFASHVSPVLEIDQASLVTAGPAGGTAFKLYFWVRDQLSGHTSAPALNTWLEIKTRGTSCNAFDGTIVKRLIGGRGGVAVGETFNAGFFYGPYVWDGSDLAGNLMAQGLYCFQFRSYTTDPAGMPMALPGTPYSGVISLGVPQAARVSPPPSRAVPIAQVLVHSLTGSPMTIPGGQAQVSYTVYQTLRNGLAFRILDSNGNEVNRPGSRPGAVLPDSTGSFSWNGKNAAGQDVPAGTYQYQLITIDGPGIQVLGQGNVVVQTAPLPPPAPACSDGIDNDGDGLIDLADSGCANAADNDETNAAANIVVSNIVASPDTFSPDGSTFTSISYTLDQPARVSVEIWRSGTRHLTLVTMPSVGMANNGIVGVNSGSNLNWGGWSTVLDRFLDDPDDNGSYEIRVTAVGSNGVLVQQNSSVTISNPVVGNVVISNAFASPQAFSPAQNQSTFISFTLSQPARMGVQVWKSATLHRTLIVLPGPGSANNGVAGINSVTWNGYSSHWDDFLNLFEDNGTYDVRVTAIGSNGVAVTRSIFVTIANPETPVGNLVISNISASPGSFSPFSNQSTTVTFSMSELGTNVNVTILNPNSSVVHTIALGNAVQGQNQFVWNGNSSNLGRMLSQTTDNGAYTIRIEGTGSNGVRVSATGSVTIANATSSNLVISSVSASPATFSPLNGQTTTVSFNVSAAATNVSATIMNASGSTVYSASFSGTIAQGQYQFIWSGVNDQGRYLTQTGDNGAYQVRINGTGANGVAVSSTPGSVTISNTVGTFSLIDQGPSRNPFNPDVESTDLRYSMTHDADVWINIFSPSFYAGGNPAPSSVSSTPVRRLLSSVFRSSGSNLQSWNGRDDSGNLVQSGVYPYLVQATSRQNGSQSYFWGYVSVNRSGIITITDLGPDKFTFNPSRGETVTIRFELNQADAPTVAILQGGSTGTSLGTLGVSLESSSSGRYVYRAVWNGRNASGSIVANDTYAYRIRATSGGSTQERIGYVRVDNGTGGGTGTGCNGYSDVASNDPLCPAIQFVVSRGIFLGDAGRNTLRPGDRLSRAETAKVLQSAFGYSLESYDEFRDGDLGFADMDESAWYMPYMKTFVIRGVMRGYPDGRMRPVQKMKTTELFKIFVEGVFEAPRALANFTLNRNVRTAPFNDTPVKSDTKWYLPYAEFAERYDLAPSEPYFYPAREITRGKVILLIYESSFRNVISYGVTNPSARTASQFTYTYGSRSPTYYRSSSSGSYVTDSIY